MFILIVICTFYSAVAFSEEPTYTITFKKGSCVLNDSIKRQLVNFGNGIFTEMQDNTERYIIIDLKNYTCSDELKKDSMIGFKRAKAIIDVLEKECKLDRKRIRYMDVLPLDKTGKVKKEDCGSLMRGIRVEING